MSKPQKLQEKQSDWVKVGPCLYRYKGGTYYALVKHGGKQIRQSLETTDPALARRKLAKFKSDLEKTDPGLARRDLAAHCKIYEQTLRGAESTLVIARLSIRRLVTEWPKGSPTEIRKIKPNDIKIWMAQYSHLSASTTNHMITEARRFFASAVEDGVIATSPMEKVKYQKLKKSVKLIPTPEQFEAIVANLRSQLENGHGAEDTADTVELAGRLGLGQAELAAICRQHIDLAAGVIKVFRRKTKSAFQIPLYPLARTIIERRLANMPDSPDARLLPHYQFRKGLQGACKRLNFPNFIPRSLRSFFCTQALRAGVDAPTVGSWQGHRDGGALVLKTYADEVRMDHSQKMAKLLAPKPAGGNVVPFEKEAVA
jgi:integrase